MRAAFCLTRWCGAPGRSGATRRCCQAGAAKHYLDAAAVAACLRTLLRHLRGRVIVVWDGGSNHKGPLIRAVCQDFPRLHLERLPAYAPDLNPVEFIWSYLKYGRMANFIPRHVRHLDQVVQAAQTTLARLQIALPWHLALLS